MAGSVAGGCLVGVALSQSAVGGVDGEDPDQVRA